ncbi:MAG: DNA replication and repair protein RecF [Gemmatimonadota bacterium]
MRLAQLRLRQFRNLEAAEFQFPASGVALLGDNGQGKTNLLEAVYYPVFFRSIRGAADTELVRFGATGFRIDAEIAGSGSGHRIDVAYHTAGRRKQIERDGVPATRLADEVGQWLAVAFLPQDLRLTAGPAAERRRYLDRMLAVADRGYYAALTHYRAAMAQRNAGLRQGRIDWARAFDQALAAAGARIVAARCAWIERASEALAAELEALGEPGTAQVAYQGHRELADCAAWIPALNAAEGRDRQRCTTTVGPHRDDVRIALGGHPVREFGSTGQQRSVAIALKFMELLTLERAREAPPALLLDDVFAELDRERQQRLADRLGRAGERQVFLSSPRVDELPPNLELPVWTVKQGRIALTP